MKEDEGYIDLKKMLFMNSILNAKFGDLFEAEELASFHEFLGGNARDAGGFVIAFPTTDLQMVWVAYEIDRDLSDRNQVIINLSPSVHLTSEPVKPETLEGIPVWWHVDESDDEPKPPQMN